MPCIRCGQKTKTEKEKLYHYQDSGLSNVYLTNVMVNRCKVKECGEEEVVIQNITRLHDSIAKEIAHGTRKLTAEEIRFLRTYLGFSGVDFAREVLCVTPETIARWEKGILEIKETSERLLRVLVLSRQEPFHNYEELRGFGTKKARPVSKRKFKLAADQWIKS